jgi:hypothetical protein
MKSSSPAKAQLDSRHHIQRLFGGTALYLPKSAT